MLKKLYDKTLKLAAHKSANFYLSVVSFIESSFFPIPPDVMIIPMSLAKKEEYLKIFFIATLFSSLGGLFGYFIGSLFTDKAIYQPDFHLVTLIDNVKMYDLRDSLFCDSLILFDENYKNFLL